MSVLVRCPCSPRTTATCCGSWSGCTVRPTSTCRSDMLFRTDRYGRPPGTRGWRVASLMEHITWALLYRPDLAFNQDGSFMACFEVRGYDLESSSPAALAGIAHRFPAALLHPGDRWALHAEGKRPPVP